MAVYMEGVHGLI